MPHELVNCGRIGCLWPELNFPTLLVQTNGNEVALKFALCNTALTQFVCFCFQGTSKGIQVLLSLLDHFKFFQKLSNILSNSTLPLVVPQGTSRACQSSATVSISSGTDTDIPYKPLGSTSQSQSGSVSSEVQTVTVVSANGKASPGVFSVASHTSSTILSGVSSSVPDTQLSRTPTSLVPLINERGLPSGYVAFPCSYCFFSW